MRSTAPEESNRKERINGEIRAQSVRLIGPEGEQIGIVKLAEALRIAEDAELDLVEIAAQADTPVCKVMDYGKYQFQLQKKNAEAKKETETNPSQRVKVPPWNRGRRLSGKASQPETFFGRGRPSEGYCVVSWSRNHA